MRWELNIDHTFGCAILNRTEKAVWDEGNSIDWNCHRWFNTGTYASNWSHQSILRPPGHRGHCQDEASMMRWWSRAGDAYQCEFCATLRSSYKLSLQCREHMFRTSKSGGSELASEQTVGRRQSVFSGQQTWRLADSAWRVNLKQQRNFCLLSFIFKHRPLGPLSARTDMPNQLTKVLYLGR